jgi:hypothetical protein
MDIRRFAAISHVPLNISSDTSMFVLAEGPLLQPEGLDKLLLRLEATFPVRARDLIGANCELMKRVDANSVLAHALRALDELARNRTENNEATCSKLWG